MSRDLRPDDLPRVRNDIADAPLVDFIPEVSPWLASPRHLKPFADILDAMPFGGLREVGAMPCQHGKTTLVQHAIAKWLRKWPRLKVIYATYGQQFSAMNSIEIRNAYLRAGGKLDSDLNRQDIWRTAQGGGLLATSVDGVGTGHSADVVIIDDPYKNRQEAENVEIREKVTSWRRGVAMTRLAPKGSAGLIMSRWHDDDESGRVIREGWRETRLAAICDDEADPLGRKIGEALCAWGPDPAKPRDEAFLAQLRADIGEYDWASLFQGRPRPREGAVFKNAHLYDELPEIVAEVGIVIGFDSATSAGARSDWTAIVVLGLGVDGKTYVLEVHRWQLAVPDAIPLIRHITSSYPDAPIVSYVSGNERGHIEVFAELEEPIIIDMMPARWSKYFRAQPTAKDWNAGEILVPKETAAPWVSPFLSEILSFTGGPGDAHDDMLDALVAARDRLRSMTNLPLERFTFGKRCM